VVVVLLITQEDAHVVAVGSLRLSFLEKNEEEEMEEEDLSLLDCLHFLYQDQDLFAVHLATSSIKLLQLVVALVVVAFLVAHEKVEHLVDYKLIVENVVLVVEVVVVVAIDVLNLELV
jgi:hypothetical protein